MSNKDQEFFEKYLADLEIKYSKLQRDYNRYQTAIADILDLMDYKVTSNRFALKIDMVKKIKAIAEKAVIKDEQ